MLTVKQAASFTMSSWHVNSSDLAVLVVLVILWKMLYLCANRNETDCKMHEVSNIDCIDGMAYIY